MIESRWDSLLNLVGSNSSKRRNGFCIGCRSLGDERNAFYREGPHSGFHHDHLARGITGERKTPGGVDAEDYADESAEG